MKTPNPAALSLFIAILALSGCAQVTEAEKARKEARTTGKYKVRLTEDSESVAGTCKFVRSINGDFDFSGPQTQAKIMDYFREEAVYYGADTVIVRDRVGEAYICGPGPLNPDGTLRSLSQPPPTPPPK